MEIVEHENLHKLITCLKVSNKSTFQHLVQLFGKLIQISPLFINSLKTNNLFIEEICDRLGRKHIK